MADHVPSFALTCLSNFILTRSLFHYFSLTCPFLSGVQVTLPNLFLVSIQHRVMHTVSAEEILPKWTNAWVHSEGENTIWRQCKSWFVCENAVIEEGGRRADIEGTQRLDLSFLVSLDSLSSPSNLFLLLEQKQRAQHKQSCIFCLLPPG